ncbi:hypothetical protein LTR62_008437 [Meristemomyces frigidus]|uniref:Peptidase A1 domain-containing protein n=1 Tax=Meristemomyces frigidus TaxID=1508187 RepID=A0AAN7YLV2_9PEZI|nr:hypothetical protein LTR62_008437 [Meristemomyces frigidus]
MARITTRPTALVALVGVSQALGNSLVARDTNTTALVTPINIAPNGNWDGIDGLWSSFTLGIGTPLQYVRTFVSFAAYQTLAVLPQGCQGATDESQCAQNRGGIYNESASSTFGKIGTYDWMIEQNLGVQGNSIYGYDTVELGSSGQGGPQLKNTTVGGYAVADLYVGMFGVNPKPTNFTNMNEGSPSYMSLLKEQGLISSVSAAYTAGASYRSVTAALGSLVLGGYDASKFEENALEFSFGFDNTRDLVVGVQSISTPAKNGSNPVPIELLPGPIYAYIDSTVPQIWLPTEACQVFETEFGLVYDNVTELYLVNNTLHTSLVERNASITFGLAQGTAGGSTIQITLPYAAFDLVASPPYKNLENQTHYFPLRRAANDTQYTLGRTFLQEAYLSVDWETQHFNVSQMQWGNNGQSNLVAIPPGTQASTSYPGTSSPSSTASSSASSNQSTGLGAGAIAGIVVGVIAGIIVAALLAYFLLRRKRKNAKARADAAMAEKLDEDGSVTTERGSAPTVFAKAELEGSAPARGPLSPADSDNRRLLSAHGSGPDPETPGTLGATSSNGFFIGHRGSSAYSPSTPTAGEGTYSSTHSDSNGTHHSSVLSPLSPNSQPNASEADSKERQVYEMAGDMPTIKEKDGRALSEKEAMALRERLYNGVDSAPTSATALVEPTQPTRERRLVSPEDVVVPAPASTSAPVAEKNNRLQLPGDVTRHRAFSFEEERGKKAGTGTGTQGSDDIYS